MLSVVEKVKNLFKGKAEKKKNASRSKKKNPRIKARSKPVTLKKAVQIEESLSEFQCLLDERRL
jgi:hypothetical protein